MGHVSPVGVIVLTAGLLTVAVVLLYHMWAFWPPPVDADETFRGTTVDYLGLWEVGVSPDTLLFVVVAVAGALGGLIHSLRSLVTHVGHRRLLWSWAPFYLTLPVVGALGGTVFYIVFRAGLFAQPNAAAEANPFGFAAVALLVGLFSEQAIAKLRRLASDLFASVPPGDGHFESVESQPDRGDGSS